LDGTSNAVGYTPSIELDAAGNPHVSYYDFTSGNLRYAYMPSLFITSPQPGVTWPVGSEQAIRWSFTGGLPIGNSNVYLSLDGGNTFTWIENSARDPEVAFRVPHTPTRFAVLRVVKSSPFTDTSMDSFFTIDASIALNKFEARVVGGSAGDEDELSRAAGGWVAGKASDAGRAVRLSWETTPGPEADIRYRVERAARSDAGASSSFVPVHAGVLDGSEIIDPGPASSGDGASDARYRLVAINGLGEEYVLGETEVAAAFSAARLLSIGPNPAPGGETRIRFRASADLLDTNLSIYDTSGRRVRTVAQGTLAAGAHDGAWDGRDEGGRPVAAGTYFMRLSWGGLARATERVVVVR
jgi:hypothetical protein